MAKKGFIKDLNDVEILPITRGELVIDSSGKEAFHSNDFLATTSLPGLMSAEDKNKLDNLEGGIKYDIVSTTADGLAPKINTTASAITTQTDEWVLTTTKGATPSWRRLPVNAFLNRPISVNGTSILENNNTALNLVAGNNITLVPEEDTGKVTIHSNVTNITGNATTADKLKNKVKLWGLEFDGSSDVTGNLYFENSRTIYCKDKNGVYNSAVVFNDDNTFRFGLGAATNGYNTCLIGNKVFLQYGNAPTTGFLLNESGNVGINTLLPEHRLHVGGDIAYAGTLYMVSNRGAFVDSDGLSRPWYGFHWNTSATNWHKRQMISNYYGMTFHSGSNSTTAIAFAFAYGSGDTYKENVTIDNSGNTFIRGTLSVGGSSTFSGLTTHNSGLSVSGINIKKSQDGVLYIDGNLVVKGGITMYGTDATSSESILDVNGSAMFRDGVYLPNSKTIWGAKVSGGVASIARINSNNNVLIGDQSNLTYIYGSGIALSYGNTNGLTLDANGQVKIINTLSVGSTTTSTGFIKQDSSDSYVLLGGGGHKAISDFLLKSELANLELSNNLTTITKELTVTQDWMDTGIKYTDLPASGTYIVQVYVKANDGTGGMYNCYWSGIMSWNIGGTNDNESDEILLHRSGHAYSNTIYLRTIMSSHSDGRHLRLLIAANRNIGAAYTYTFKFKRII